MAGTTNGTTPNTITRPGPRIREQHCAREPVGAAWRAWTKTPLLRTLSARARESTAPPYTHQMQDTTSRIASEQFPPEHVRADRRNGYCWHSAHLRILSRLFVPG